MSPFHNPRGETFIHAARDLRRGLEVTSTNFPIFDARFNAARTARLTPRCVRPIAARSKGDKVSTATAARGLWGKN